MRGGRSAWTLAVLALGVGALFLVGWRIDALSTPTDPDQAGGYFVATSGPRREKREEGWGGGEEIEREDRGGAGYSPLGRETSDTGRSRESSFLGDGDEEDGWRNLGKEEEEEGRTISDEDGSRSVAIGWGKNNVAVYRSLSRDLGKREGNHGSVDDLTKVSFPWNQERDEENEDGSSDGESASSSPLGDYVVERNVEDRFASVNREEKKDGIKEDPVEKSVETKNEQRIEDEKKRKDSSRSLINFEGKSIDGSSNEKSEGDYGSREENSIEVEIDRKGIAKKKEEEDRIPKGIDLAWLERSGNGGREEEDGSGFWTGGDVERRTGALNGSSERSDVEENWWREVNGRSMNEAEKKKSSGQSYYYYYHLADGLSSTRRGQLDANDEADEARQVGSNGARSSRETFQRSRTIPWNRNEEERSIEKLNEISADFHNFERAEDAERGYKRGEESSPPDSLFPPATPRRVSFHRDSTRSSANAFHSPFGVSREGRNIVEEARSNPRVQFRGIDEKKRWRDGEATTRLALASAEEEEEEDFESRRKEESFRKIGEKVGGIRGKRYANYYSQQSATPMAYVHIQPVYPVAQAPSPSRKCVQCMVVYKPCPSTPRQPQPFPTYKYQELASKWFGLKYGK